MKTLNEIVTLTEDFSRMRTALSEKVQTLEDEITAIKRRYLPGIKRAVNAAAEKQAELKGALEEAPELFVKPRTIVIAGIKVGYQKGKGKLLWDDDDTVIRLIKKHFPEQADVLIATVEMPAKKALEQLSVHDLKRIGVVVEEVGDQIVIKSTDSEIDKLVSALLKDEDMNDAKAA